MQWCKYSSDGFREVADVGQCQTTFGSLLLSVQSWSTRARVPVDKARWVAILLQSSCHLLLFTFFLLFGLWLRPLTSFHWYHYVLFGPSCHPFGLMAVSSLLGQHVLYPHHLLSNIITSSFYSSCYVTTCYLDSVKCFRMPFTDEGSRWLLPKCLKRLWFPASVNKNWAWILFLATQAFTR